MEWDVICTGVPCKVTKAEAISETAQLDPAVPLDLSAYAHKVRDAQIREKLHCGADRLTVGTLKNVRYKL